MTANEVALIVDGEADDYLDQAHPKAVALRKVATYVRANWDCEILGGWCATHNDVQEKCSGEKPAPYTAQSGTLLTILRSLRDNGVAADKNGYGACGPMSERDVTDFLLSAIETVYGREEYP